MSGLFVVLEGGEGAGKSTLAAALTWALQDEGHEVVVTHEPGATPLGARLREILLHTPDVDVNTQVLLFAADRADHVATLIRPALERGAIVICDRYIDSSIAYQGAAGADPEQVAFISEVATNGLKPDLTILLDVEPDVRRARRGEGSDVFERKSEDFHATIRRTFLDLAQADEQDRYRVFPADLPPAMTLDLALSAIYDAMGDADAPHTASA